MLLLFLLPYSLIVEYIIWSTFIILCTYLLNALDIKCMDGWIVSVDHADHCADHK